MYSIRRLRSFPPFAKLFANVHPLCWLVLWWELNRLIRWFDRARPEDVLFSVDHWGLITICYIAPRIDPTLYKPRPRTFRPLTDPIWESNRPACLDTDAAWRLDPFIARPTGVVSPEAAQRALASPVVNTS